MLQQELQLIKNLVSRSNFSSNKTLDILDTTYIDTLYSYDIVINLLERKISKEFTSLKEQILQKRFLLQLDN